MRYRTSTAFTLIELLVVVTIIVVLLALLVPAMDKAIAAAERAKCLSNVRTTVQGCAQYAFSQKRTLPVYTIQDQGRSSAYDMRTWETHVIGPRAPLGLGLLVRTQYMPASRGLGELVHCPTFDNSSGPYPKHCMDVASPYGWGGSFWSENEQYRIINGYNYRAASYYNAGKGHMQTNRMSSKFLLYVDVADVRFRGVKGAFNHVEGYSRAFGDGSADFLLDPKHEVERILTTSHPGGNTEGIMHGGVGSADEAKHEERVWELMAVGSVVQAAP